MVNRFFLLIYEEEATISHFSFLFLAFFINFYFIYILTFRTANPSSIKSFQPFDQATELQLFILYHTSDGQDPVIKLPEVSDFATSTSAKYNKNDPKNTERQSHELLSILFIFIFYYLGRNGDSLW